MCKRDMHTPHRPQTNKRRPYSQRSIRGATYDTPEGCNWSAKGVFEYHKARNFQGPKLSETSIHKCFTINLKTPPLISQMNSICENLIHETLNLSPLAVVSLVLIGEIPPGRPL